MTQNLRFSSLATIIILVLSACSWPGNKNPVIPNPPLVSAVELTVQADTSVPFNAVGQVIKYNYLVKNTGTVPLPAPVSVTDDKATPTCSEVKTVGNFDDFLDVGEMIACTGTYTITQPDLDGGSVTDIASASASGTASAPVTTKVTLVQNKALTLSKSADPVTYSSASQTVIYTYTIKNTGNVTLGPVQFSVSDDKIGAAFNCGSSGTSLAPNATMTCSATYAITQADLNAGLVTNNASASDGVTTSNNATSTINKASTSNPNPPSTSLVPGTTVPHRVVAGEWLWQIARCYGADPRQVIQANPQLPDPARILPDIMVTVPDIGSRGIIYGPPCVRTHSVQSSDTWDSIAKLYNADTALLQRVNPGGLSPGRVLKVPINSAGAALIYK